jgi:hypothetical protein
MVPLADQPGEIRFCVFTKVNGWRSPCGAHRFRTCWHHDRVIMVLGSDWACQLPRVYGNGGHGRR